MATLAEHKVEWNYLVLGHDKEACKPRSESPAEAHGEAPVTRASFIVEF